MVRFDPRRLLLDQDGSNTGGYYGSKRNFDSKMVIILTALFCALICALGLNSIVRCAMRCGRRLAFETEEETAARLAVKGLKKKALQQIPTAAYSRSMNMIRATDCIICLGEFVEGEMVRVLPKCYHGFHVSCIDTWLLSHSSCPTCRQSLAMLNGAVAFDAVGGGGNGYNAPSDLSLDIMDPGS
ncbi:hypothetical protein Nepgr_017284 [Nepenthes gracilis]|uniref:RING-type E3 ubiquitin transferase n=1 Tax=Nepenthes gracilis TaxID=150966 RepID=A0AAD3SQ51_NEPGR|nr:hypothetical protein Nepgr_017284 [Nepenthes gracilis]